MAWCFIRALSQTFLEKARECEQKCDGRRKALPECDLFCIDEACFTRVFGKVNVLESSEEATQELNDPEKLTQFTRCAKLRMLPAVPAAWRDKKILKVAALFFCLFLCLFVSLGFYI